MQLNKRFWTVLAFLVLGCISSSTIFANTKATAEEYIQKYKGIAISEMKKHGIPASIKLAQGLLESGIGTSKLAVQGNNHFGIKCHTVWTGPSMKHTDDAPNECFRVYSDPKESYQDHSHFLMSRPWYNPLFKLKTNDYKGWAYGLKKAGYATNPRYAEMLIDVIERHQLYVYDMDLSEKEMEQYRLQLIDQEKETLIALQNNDVNFKNTPVVTLPSTKNPSHVSHNAGVIFYNNNVKVVRVTKGQSIQEIAKIHGLSVSQLRKFNDLTAKQDIQEGQLVYLASKKNKAKQKKHLVLSHDNMWSISQNYGIKLDKLYEKNLMKKGEEPAVGASLSLKKKSKTKPALRNNTKTSTPNAPVTVPVQSNPSKPTTVSTSEPTKETHTTVQKDQGINFNPFTYALGTTQASTQPVSNTLYHTVQSGETLYSISRQYNVTVDQIKNWNNMMDYQIQLHQQLIIFR